ncbi:flagellar motor switch protein FliN, partial [Rhizobium leguminosarum]
QVAVGILPQFGDDPQSDPFAAGTDLAAFGGEASESTFGGDDFGGDFGGSASSAAGMDFGRSPSLEESPAPLGSALNSNLDLIMDIPI